MTNREWLAGQQAEYRSVSGSLRVKILSEDHHGRVEVRVVSRYNPAYPQGYEFAPRASCLFYKEA